VSLEIDGKPIGERTIKNVFVANGQFCGGGLRAAKNARLDDGVFDVIIMGNLTFKESFLWAPKLYRGNIIDFTEKVEYFQAKQVRAASDEVVLVDMDGEQPGMLPITLTIMPSAIRLKTGPQA
jgi:diacylglycerol kinase family enzyme